MTWRQLFAMSLGAWDRTAFELAVTMDVNRDRKKNRKPFMASDFHPIDARRVRARVLDGRGLQELFGVN